MASNQAKRGRPPVRRVQVVLALRDCKVATAKDLNVSAAYLSTLIEKNIIEQCGDFKSGTRGRPQKQYKLSKSGQGVALNLHRKAQKPVAAQRRRQGFGWKRCGLPASENWLSTPRQLIRSGQNLDKPLEIALKLAILFLSARTTKGTRWQLRNGRTRSLT